MNFRKYQHLEKFGNTAVEGIENGTCYVFPKIDGTNASIWLGDDNTIQAGSRTRVLSIDNDNAGFYEWVLEQENIKKMLLENPDIRLYGEWLVPHSLKTYREDAWRNFYVFDVIEEIQEEDGEFRYLPYEEYKVLCEEYNVNYIPPLKIIKNGEYENFVHELANNIYLIEDGKGNGEGIVLKNYSFVNKYGRVTWAKIITSEFKEKHHKEMGAPEVENKIIEDSIADEYVTTALCEKVHAKIENELGEFNNKQIPRLLNTVYHDVITEELWDILKKHKNPTINFKTLKYFVFGKVKERLPKLF